MESLTLKAHFNGTQVVFDEPADLETNARLLIRVLPEGRDPENEEWILFSAQHFNAAFGEYEPEYGLDDLIEINPEYERR